MGTKQIRVSERLYARIQSEKRAGETTGDALERMVGDYDLLDFAADAAGTESLDVERIDGGDPGAKETAETIETERVPVRIPTPVVFEVFYGIEGADDPESLLGRYEALLASKPRLELSEQAARRGGRLYSRHGASDEKQRLDLVDAMVAATALETDEPVVTNDSAFQDVDGLRVRTY